MLGASLLDTELSKVFNSFSATKICLLNSTFVFCSHLSRLQLLVTLKSVGTLHAVSILWSGPVIQEHCALSFSERRKKPYNEIIQINELGLMRYFGKIYLQPKLIQSRFLL